MHHPCRQQLSLESGVLTAVESDWGTCVQVKPWLGALDTHAALLAALEARSHKREVVITIFTESWVEITAQQWASMARLGMGHILALGVPGRSACDSLARVVPSTS